MKNVVLVCVLLLGVPFLLVGCGDKEPAKTDGGTSEHGASEPTIFSRSQRYRGHGRRE